MEWLQTLVDSFLQWFPRFDIIRSTHQGIAYVRGRPRVVKGPRMYFWWPITTELQLYPIKRQSLNPDPQPLTTKDGRTVAVSLMVIYEITDILKALTKQWDLEDTVADKALLATARYVTKRTFEETMADDGSELESEIKASLHDWGIKVLEAGLVGCAEGRVLFVLGDGSSLAVDEEEGND